MIKALRYFFEHHKIALFGFLGALLCALYFGISMAADFIYFHDPRHQNEALKAWMTPRYVSMSYRVPPKEFKEILDLQSMDGKKNTMQAIAERKGIELSALEEIVREGAEDYHEREREKREQRKQRREQETEARDND